MKESLKEISETLYEMKIKFSVSDEGDLEINLYQYIDSDNTQKIFRELYYGNIHAYIKNNILTIYTH